MSRRVNLGTSVLLSVLIFGGTMGAKAQNSVTTTRTTIIEKHSSTPSGSTVITEEQSGVMGFKNSNKVNYKYKERLKTYAEQIEIGQTKGWLTADEVTQFKKELGRLNTLEAQVSGNGYVKAEVDDLEKQVTKFNMDLTAAANKKPGTTAASKPAPAAAAASTMKTTSASADKKPAAKKPVSKATKTATSNTKK